LSVDVKMGISNNPLLPFAVNELTSARMEASNPTPTPPEEGVIVIRRVTPQPNVTQNVSTNP
jgi:hypothetical protein